MFFLHAYGHDKGWGLSGWKDIERKLYSLRRGEIASVKSSKDSKFISESPLSSWLPQGGWTRFAQSSTHRSWETTWLWTTLSLWNEAGQDGRLQTSYKELWVVKYSWNQKLCDCWSCWRQLCHRVLLILWSPKMENSWGWYAGEVCRWFLERHRTHTLLLLCIFLLLTQLK